MVNSQYSHMLLNLLLNINKKRPQNINLISNVITRVKYCAVAVLLYFKYSLKKQRLTVLTGDAIKYGAGSLELNTPSFASLIKILWDQSLNIQISPPINGLSLQRLLMAELGQNKNSELNLIFTAQEILMIQYACGQQTLLKKVTKTQIGNAYLTRQVSGLSDNKYLNSLSLTAIKHPIIIKNTVTQEHQKTLVQTFVQGDVIALPYVNVKSLQHQFYTAVQTAIKINRMSKSQTNDWHAYGDFEKLPAYFSAYQQPLIVIVDYLTNWLGERALPCVHIHGDYHFGNIIFDQSHQVIVGLIDFDRSCAGGTELHDSLMLFLTLFSSRATGSPLYFAEVVNQVIEMKHPDKVFYQMLNDISTNSGYDIDDIKHMAIILWLFLLQSAMREQTNTSQNWNLKMLANTVPVALKYCNDLINAKNNKGILCSAMSSTK